jgi:hypothetical protein
MTDRPTIASEAQWLIDNLRWIYDNEPKWDDFAKDVAAARRRLEAVLYAGERDERTRVPCIDCNEGRDSAPIRILLVVHYATDKPGWTCPECRRKGTEDHWFCPRCKRQYDAAALRMAERADLERQGLARWLTIDVAADALQVPRSRLRPLVAACEISSRSPMVFWPDVRAAQSERASA